jgi:hypothetical protein
VLLKTTLLHYGNKPTGVFNPCHSCMIYKAQQKLVNKFTDIIVTKPGERLYIDTSGPLPNYLGGNNYWVKIKDQYSGMSWNIFVKQKLFIASVVLKQLQIYQGLQISVKFICCDNAG